MTSRALTITATALALAFWAAPGLAQDNPATTEAATNDARMFSSMAGAWSGTGIVNMSIGGAEQLRCRANYSAGDGGSSLAMVFRCSSDNFNVQVTGNLTRRDNRIEGTWRESGTGFSGTLAGDGADEQIRTAVTGPGFTAALVITTRDGLQTVMITPRGTIVTSVQITLHRGG